MKKLLVTALAACTIIGSFASVSMAYYELLNMGYENRFNGSYYYDIAWAEVYVSKNDFVKVIVILMKNGTKVGRTTRVNGHSDGNRMTCYSGTIQGTGADNAKATFL